MNLRRGQRLDGRYRVLERIGSGTHAEVYLAEDEENRRARVAVKLFHREQEPDPSFEKELELLGPAARDRRTGQRARPVEVRAPRVWRRQVGGSTATRMEPHADLSHAAPGKPSHGLRAEGGLAGTNRDQRPVSPGVLSPSAGEAGAAVSSGATAGGGLTSR